MKFSERIHSIVHLNVYSFSNFFTSHDVSSVCTFEEILDHLFTIVRSAHQWSPVTESSYIDFSPVFNQQFCHFETSFETENIYCIVFILLHQNFNHCFLRLMSTSRSCVALTLTPILIRVSSQSLSYLPKRKT